MRRRLLVSTLVVAVVSIMLLGVPLGVVATKLIRDEAQKRMNREASQIATLIDGRADRAPIDNRMLARYTASDREVVVRLAAGTQVSAGERVKGPLQKGTAMGSQGEAVTVYASDSEINQQVVTVWALVGGLAVLALGIAVALARLQAKQLVGPIEDLVETAEHLGNANPRPSRRRYGVRELDQVAVVLDRSAERINQLLAAERRLATDASHQLRTPLTALSIRLEEILATSTDPDVRDEAAAALTQAERLAAVVDALLANARSARSSAVLVDVDEVLDQQTLEWSPVFRRLGRELRLEGRRGLKAYSTPGGLAQVVATLIDNALTHGGGRVSLRTRHSAGHVVLEVADEGTGVPEELAPHIFERSVSGSRSTGLGLALARDLVEADGGRLELVQQRPAVFAVFLSPDVAG